MIETAVKLALEFEAFQGSRKIFNPPRANKAPMRVPIEEPIKENSTSNYSQNRSQEPRPNQKVCIYCTHLSLRTRMQAQNESCRITAI